MSYAGAFISYKIAPDLKKSSSCTVKNRFFTQRPTPVRAPVTKQPPTSAAHTRLVRAGRPRARRGRAKAFFLPVKKKAECTRAVRPRVKPLPHLMRRRLNAGRRNVKSDISAYFSHRRRKRGGGEKRAGVSPRGAPQAPRGAGRVLAGIGQDVKPCISPPAPGASACVQHTANV